MCNYNEKHGLESIFGKLAAIFGVGGGTRSISNAKCDKYINTFVQPQGTPIPKGDLCIMAWSQRLIFCSLTSLLIATKILKGLTGPSSVPVYCHPWTGVWYSICRGMQVNTIGRETVSFSFDSQYLDNKGDSDVSLQEDFGTSTPLCLELVKTPWKWT